MTRTALLACLALSAVRPGDAYPQRLDESRATQLVRHGDVGGPPIMGAAPTLESDLAVTGTSVAFPAPAGQYRLDVFDPDGARVGQAAINGALQFSTSTPGTYYVGLLHASWPLIVRVERRVLTVLPTTPPPPAPSSPPQPAAPPPPTEVCDVLVIGLGIAGASAKLLAQHECGASRRVCSVALDAPSTTVRAGIGTFYLPVVPADEVPTYVQALQAIDPAVSPLAATRLLQNYTDARRAFEAALNVTAVDLANLDTKPRPCADFDCDACGRIADFGSQSCDLASAIYQVECCDGAANTSMTSFFETHPSYRHLNGTWRHGGVLHFSKSAPDATASPAVCAASEPFTMNDLTVAARAAPDHFVDRVVDVAAAPTGWRVSAEAHVFSASQIVFATGGHGAHLPMSERLARYQARDVHATAIGTSDILPSVASAQQWTSTPPYAWHLPHASGVPAWFHWQDGATVVALDSDGTWHLVVDESADYDQRGKQMAHAHVTDALLLYRASVGGAPLATGLAAYGYGAGTAEAIWTAVETDDVSKRCDSASKRHWRNAPTTCGYDAYYPPSLQPRFGVVDVEACSARIRRGDDSIVVERLTSGIIDTAHGPRIDPTTARVLDTDGTVYAIGNAADPLLAHAYLAPGMTLGNGLLGGYLAAHGVCQ